MRVDDRVPNGLGVLAPIVRSGRSFRALLGFEFSYSQNGFAHESVNRVGVEAGMPCLRDTQLFLAKIMIFFENRKMKSFPVGLATV
jgi:hypothetical protein